MLHEKHFVKKINTMFFFFFPPSSPLSPTVFKTRYQIVMEIVQATTISNIPQVKRQKGKIPFS